MNPTRLILCAVLACLPGIRVLATDWPQFRGPGGLGAAVKEAKLPAKWADGANIAWKVELPGPGSSSPIVVGDRVLVTCYSGYGTSKGQTDTTKLRRHLLCFDRAGKPLWQKEVHTDANDYPYSDFQTMHGYASATPASDGKNVYVFFGVAGVLGFDLDGNELWRQSVGTKTSKWGSGTSPVLYKDLVIVNAGVESGQLVALHKDTGAPAWTAKGMNQSWTTPLLVDVGGHTEVVVSVRSKLLAFDPAKGTPLWSCHGIDDYVCSSVIAHDGVVFAIGGRANTAIAVQPDGKGQVKELWRIKKGSNVSSPVYHDGHLYWANDGGGRVYCVKASDGSLAYEKRVDPPPQRIYASGTYGDGKIYYVSRNDGTYVVAANPTFEQLAHNELKSDRSVFNASPAIADGRLYLRSDRCLYCIGKASK